MTFGNQNSELEACEQMNYALDQGVNFFDTAEMYAVPPSAENQGKTETYIGNWFASSGRRDQVVLATKVTGPTRGMNWIRKDLNFTKESITKALEGSLKRLKTDYIDLYQLHWPERNVNIFSERNYSHDFDELWQDNFNDILLSLDGFIKQGKIRHVGISNETPFGTMRFLEESKKGLPRMKTIQNPYSLLNRTFEYGLSEIAMREDIGLLAYSPLGFGILSGKYLNQAPADGRVTLFPQYKRYSSDQSTAAVRRYLKIAQEHTMSLTHLALAFINQQPFVTSNIIGATKMQQLKENIDSVYVNLSAEILEKIAAVHSSIPDPAP
jgi:aryl-alcohol dehydrogenase-like predicted oxidoreductase